MLSKIVRSVLLALVATSSSAVDLEEAKTTAKELGQALREHMTTTYTCQRFLGGLAQYRAAKFLAIDVHTRVTHDRNKAVLAADAIEQKLKALKADEKMEAQFKSTGVSYVDSVRTCQELTAESADKIQVLEAKLGML